MIQPRPQPIGLFQFPASHLLLPATTDCQECLEALMLGDLETRFPQRWMFFRSAATGAIDQALQLVGDGQDDFSVYNRFVLEPSKESYSQARESLTGRFGELLDLAAYSVGVLDTVPRETGLDGELLAFALATSAAADIENGSIDAASEKLERAAGIARTVSPILAATLLAQLGDLVLSCDEPSDAMAIQHFQEAIRLAANCRLPLFLAELNMKLGTVYHNAADGRRGPLLQAVNCYQAALASGISRENHPAFFAELQNNLGLAYLAMPANGSSSQLRVGIAVQSFRHALEAIDVQTHTELWASINMNLANALQYAPTSHPEENLIRAVEIYEEVLQVRSRERDPVAYSLVLMNQANALAHLGIFKPALEKLAETVKLFHWYDRPEQAHAARELVDQINERMGSCDHPAEVTTG